MKLRELQPIKEDPKDFDEVEAKIRELFKRELYIPLLKLLGLPIDRLTNTLNDLVDALQTGQITFYRGTFSGRFDSAISRELKRIGAKWDRRQGVFKIPASSLPMEVRQAVYASHARFADQLGKIDEHLKKIVPEEIADKLKIGNLFESTIWKTDRDFRASMKGLTLPPKLPDARKKRIADEWENNLKLHIKDWTQEEIGTLRKRVQKSVFTGNRYESLIKTIEQRYQVSENKAKFLARQETSLLMTKFKETRYVEAGVNEYRWGCVAGSKNHPVRHDHKILEGDTFTWNNPPITNRKTGARNNPGQDYNCRCFARPIVRF